MQMRAVFAFGLAIVGAAWAADPAPAPADEEMVPRLKCRSFQTDPGAEVDTRDPATELGRWVMALEDRGWRVHQVDWEVGAKQTGFPQGYTHVCLSPR
ncbi:MAG: hypothetical protein ABMA64_31460 [Myxococcota bacterium]